MLHAEDDTHQDGMSLTAHYSCVDIKSPSWAKMPQFFGHVVSQACLAKVIKIQYLKWVFKEPGTLINQKGRKPEQVVTDDDDWKEAEEVILGLQPC